MVGNVRCVLVVVSVLFTLPASQAQQPIAHDVRVVASQRCAPAGAIQATSVIFSPIRDADVVWQQVPAASPWGTAAQDFTEPEQSAYDVWTFSDFTTDQYWCVSDAVCAAFHDVYTEGSEPTITVIAEIWDELPWNDGTIVLSSVAGIDDIETEGLLKADFGEQVLAPGHYYFTIYPVRPFDPPGGQVFLYHTDDGSGVPDYQWNPGGGFGFGEYRIIPDADGHPDEINFVLYGRPGQCEPFEGACCSEDPPDCELLTEFDCNTAGGTYAGDETLCDKDCDDNGRADTCDILFGFAADCNENGIPDGCDVDTGTSEDCNDDGVLDECQLEGNDCNGNGVLDECEVPPLGDGADCNGNLIPDECEVDCDDNGVPDDCDIAGGVSVDIDANGIPDACQCRPGDIDLVYDGIIDLSDLEVFAGCLAGPAAFLDSGCYPADADGDCDVDLADATALQRRFGNEDSVELLVTELAGEPLSEFPHFEYVRTFNEDSSVFMTVDPARFPRLFGRLCDVYVVEAKDAAAWGADPALIDVRPGGPQIVELIGTSVTANVYELAEPFVLEGMDGVGLGHEYDIVIDADRNAVLSGPDVIDGFGDLAGFYVVPDLTEPGPFEVSSMVIFAPSECPNSWQRWFWPTDPAGLDQLPIILLSHEKGGSYAWYDYLVSHLASYGYLAVAHQTVTFGDPPAEDASKCTVLHTDKVLELLPTLGSEYVDIADVNHLVWSGHGVSGEATARAYQRVIDGVYPVPEHFTIEDIALLCAIAPSTYQSPYQVNPHETPFYLLYGASDPWTAGTPAYWVGQPFQIFERAAGVRFSTYIHGAGHMDFTDSPGGEPDGMGPYLLLTEKTHAIAKAMFLAVLEYQIRGNPATRDFLTRPWQRFRPIGATADSVVVHDARVTPPADHFVIDDYETEPAVDVSSSGGSVVYNVDQVTEASLADYDDTFTWVGAGDPMNGMTRSYPGDPTHRGVVFEFSGDGPHFYEWKIIPGARDFTVYGWLSFRAAQMTRHPLTTAELGDLNFAVTLRDVTGWTSTINLKAYTAGIGEPYQRTGGGPGVGWQDEFETVRIRLTDFLADGSMLDLSDVVAVRLEFGQAYGAAQGRIAVDTVELTPEE